MSLMFSPWEFAEEPNQYRQSLEHETIRIYVMKVNDVFRLSRSNHLANISGKFINRNFSNVVAAKKAADAWLVKNKCLPLEEKHLLLL